VDDLGASVTGTDVDEFEHQSASSRLAVPR